MSEEYKILVKGSEAEIVEKKSRFIATIRPVTSQEEAVSFINEMKKKYYDARHNCSAYIIGRDNPLMYSSDDGEPSGTAGKPMLEVIGGAGARDIAVVVTRYFGGVLLGTGGLVRAYTEATAEALKTCTLATLTAGCELSITIDYNSVGKIEYLISSVNAVKKDAVYTENVTLIVHVTAEDKETLVKKIVEATAAKAVITDNGEVDYYL